MPYDLKTSSVENIYKSFIFPAAVVKVHKTLFICKDSLVLFYSLHFCCVKLFGSCLWIMFSQDYRSCKVQ